MDDLVTKQLWEDTERLREELHDIAMKQGINSPGTIRASQLLDIKINEYYRCQRQSRLRSSRL
ncbi:aspartyl-phosphate phosphatase Spo0E family protein [Pelosinus propionicus]|uniref:Spo0E like sporulation regulatory protein n=1 Tax=Pelosinus propionicus DSM 13327 TaxID=1123291 RepID=A0A1I4P2J8_9FIRM|nr:aspartyl-phosphate phosphatase Spo0E family protein [Pelosinus propionicus]SFM21757.1 Spo0E like sporulation regulatory protein [Pelosinus propionicus DSM 13327]